MKLLSSPVPSKNTFSFVFIYQNTYTKILLLRYENTESKIGTNPELRQIKEYKFRIGIDPWWRQTQDKDKSRITRV